ncbi:hypothetical protein CBER1_11749 [Cercospora berteroae]|uniref:F-box domain-containing protein n=1 Tax=Cercospora berteroae TaxID=357750 RepID=A0A2S6C043_9PEZI|nr:hypothetical protein CBER1_11749 [Cercospora berteroae]
MAEGTAPDTKGLVVSNKPLAAKVTNMDGRNFLGSLAAELHIAIAEECDEKTLLNLRRVCRSLAEDTNDVFVKGFFGTTHHELTVESMEKLCAITRIPSIARHIHTLSLDIGQRHWRPNESQNIHRELPHWRAKKQGTLRVQSWRHSRKTAIDFHLLTTALLQSNHTLRKLSIRLDEVHVDPVFAAQDLSSEDRERLGQVCSTLETLDVVLHHDEDPAAFAQVDELYGLLRVSSLQAFSVASYGYAGVTHLYQTLGATQLRSLQLQDESFSTSADLIEVLEHYHESLERLSLRGVTNHDTNRWPTVLQYIRDNMSLEELNVYCVDAYFGYHQFGTEGIVRFTLRLQPSAMKERLTELLVPFSDETEDF